ncbi:MAG: hypothetical protein ABI182_08675 [Candidatus Baltobacteraceae bacterium]
MATSVLPGEQIFYSLIDREADRHRYPMMLLPPRFALMLCLLDRARDEPKNQL